jgi:hypothetical protein
MVAAVRAANKACTRDQDCALVQLGHACSGACPVAVAADAGADLRAVVGEVNTSCAGFREQRPTHYAASRCAIVHARCQAGQCVARQPAELGAYCCRQACRHDPKIGARICRQCGCAISS